MAKKERIPEFESLKEVIPEFDALKKKDEIGAGTVLASEEDLASRLPSPSSQLPKTDLSPEKGIDEPLTDEQIRQEQKAPKTPNTFERFPDWPKYGMGGNPVPFSKRYNDYISNYEANMTDQEVADLNKQSEEVAKQMEFAKPNDKKLDRTDLLLQRVLTQESVMMKAVALPLAKTAAGLTEAMTNPTVDFKQGFANGWKEVGANIRQAKKDLSEEEFSTAENLIAFGTGLLADAGVFKGLGMATGYLYNGTKYISKGLSKFINPALADKIAANTAMNVIEPIVAGGVRSAGTLAAYDAAQNMLDAVHDGVPLEDIEYGEMLKSSGKAALTGFGLGTLGATTNRLRNAVDRNIVSAGHKLMYKAGIGVGEFAGETSLFAAANSVLYDQPFDAENFIQSGLMVGVMKATGAIQGNRKKPTTNKKTYIQPFTAEESRSTGVGLPTEIKDVQTVLTDPNVPLTAKEKIAFSQGVRSGADFGMTKSTLGGKTVKKYNQAGELISEIDYPSVKAAKEVHYNDKNEIMFQEQLIRSDTKLNDNDRFEIEGQLKGKKEEFLSAIGKPFKDLTESESSVINRYFELTEKAIQKKDKDLDNAAKSNADNDKVGEPIQTEESMREDMTKDGYTPKRIEEMMETYKFFTGKYKYTPAEYAKLKEEGKLPQKETKAEPPTEELLTNMVEPPKGGTDYAIQKQETGKVDVGKQAGDGPKMGEGNAPHGENVKAPQEKEIKEGGLFLGGFNLKDNQINDFVKNIGASLFRARGNKPKSVQELDIQRKNNITTSFKAADMAMRELNDAIKETYGRRVPGGIGEKIDTALKTIGQTPETKANALSTLPSEIQPQVIKLRDFLDNASDQLIASGVVGEKLIPTFELNKGTYVTRAYRAHTDKRWTWKFLSAKKPQLIENAVKDVMGSNPDMTQEEATGILKGMLYENPFDIVVKSGNRLGAKDAGILFKKQDLSQPIREFLGEYKDPMMNFAISVAKMATLAENHKFLTKVKEVGMNRFLFKEPVDGYRTPIAEPGDYRMAPLTTKQKWVDADGKPVEVRKSLYTSKEIANEFADIFGITHQIKDPVLRTIWNLYAGLNSIIRQGKTKYSLKTAQRNLISSFMPNIAAGAINPLSPKNLKAAKTAIQYYGYEFGAKGNPELKRLIIEMTKRGVLGENTNSKMLLADANVKAQFYDDFGSLNTNSGWRNLDRGVSKYYRMGDDVHKVFRFMYETSNYKDIFKKRFVDKTPQEIESLAMNKASKIIRATMQTYSLVPKGITALRHIPAVGGVFPSFPYEVIRNTVGLGKLIAEEIKSPDTRTLGLRRIASFAGVLGSTAGISAYFATKNNMSDDDEKNLQKFIYKEAQLDDVVVLENKGDGVYIAWNPTYSDYYSYLKKFAIYPWTKEETFGEGFQTSVTQFFGPFIGKDIIGQTLLDVSNNKAGFGGARIYNEAEDWDIQTRDVMEYLRKQFQPGFTAYFERLSRSIGGRSKMSSAEETFAEITGQRTMTINVGLSFQQQAKKLGELIGNAQYIYIQAYNDIKYKRGMSDPDLPNKKAEAEDKVNEYIQQLNDLYESAKSLGVPKRELDEIVNKGIKIGNYPPNEAVRKAIKYKDRKIQINAETKKMY
jgi:hypothetical protein